MRIEAELDVSRMVGDTPAESQVLKSLIEAKVPSELHVSGHGTLRVETLEPFHAESGYYYTQSYDETLYVRVRWFVSGHSGEVASQVWRKDKWTGATTDGPAIMMYDHLYSEDEKKAMSDLISLVSDDVNKNVAKDVQTDNLEQQFAAFQPGGHGAFATGCILDDPLQDTHQEWCERGTIDGRGVEIYWLFSNEEASVEDGADMPFDADHIDRIEVLDE